RLEVEGEALLVSVERDERRALLAPVRRCPRPSVVAAPRAFDLDDLGAHVSEDLGAEGPGDVLCQVGNDHAFERWSHGRESITARCPRKGRHSGQFGLYAVVLLGSAWPLLPWRALPTNWPTAVPR